MPNFEVTASFGVTYIIEAKDEEDAENKASLECYLAAGGGYEAPDGIDSWDELDVQLSEEEVTER